MVYLSAFEDHTEISVALFQVLVQFEHCEVQVVLGLDEIFTLKESVEEVGFLDFDPCGFPFGLEAEEEVGVLFETAGLHAVVCAGEC